MSNPKPDTYMPLVVGDYLKDTMHLNATEHGAYLLLIMHYWCSGPPPDEDRQLAAICRTAIDAWPDVRRTIAKFFIISDGQWTHKRVEAELARARSLLDRAQRGGKARAEKAARDPAGKMLAVKQPANAQPKPSTATATAYSDTTYRTPEGVDVVDVSTLAFNAGVQVIAASIGGEQKARSMVGKWRKDHGEAAVIDAIGQCQRAGPSEPISFITAVLNRPAKQPAPPRPRIAVNQPG